MYGTALGSVQLDASASVPGTFIYTPAAGTILGAGSQRCRSPSRPPIHRLHVGDGDDHDRRHQATPSITWNTPAPIVYGTALGSSQLDATASVVGTLTYSPAAGAVLGAGTQTLSVILAPADLADYATATATTTIIVEQATPSITWNTPAPIVYGTALGTSQLDASASMTGPSRIARRRARCWAPGPRRSRSTFTPNDPTDYTTATATTTITVSQATPSITWNTPTSIAYGTALGSSQLDATTDTLGTFTYSPAAGTILGAGTQTLSVTFTPTDATDYNTVGATTTIIVSKATPTVRSPAAVSTTGTRSRRRRPSPGWTAHRGRAWKGSARR